LGFCAPWRGDDGHGWPCRPSGPYFLKLTFSFSLQLFWTLWCRDWWAYPLEFRPGGSLPPGVFVLVPPFSPLAAGHAVVAAMTPFLRTFFLWVRPSVFLNAHFFASPPVPFKWLSTWFFFLLHKRDASLKDPGLWPPPFSSPPPHCFSLRFFYVTSEPSPVFFSPDLQSGLG